MDTEKTRRDVLKIGAAGSLTVVGSMAGCSGLLGGDGGASYKSWLYAPGTIGEEDHYSFTVTDHRDIRDNEDELGDFYDAFESQEDSFPLSAMDVDYDEMNLSISPSNGTAIRGSFSGSDAVSELEDNEDFEDEDEHEGYTVFVAGGGENATSAPRAIGINGSTAVAERSSPFGDSPDPQDVVETLIDTDAGNEERYGEDNEDMNVVLNRVGSGSIVDGSTQEETEETNAEQGQFEGEVASGRRIRINGETTTNRQVLVFASSDDVNTNDIETWTETDTFDDVDNISISQSGRRITITGETDTDEFGGQSS
jgi:hypothetical protein